MKKVDILFLCGLVGIGAGSLHPGLAASQGIPVAEAATLSFLNKERSNWQRYYDAGLKAYNEHRYAVTLAQVDLALKELNHSATGGERMAKTRLLLAQAYAGLKRFEEAGKLFNLCLPSCKRYFGPQSLETAACFYGLAQTDLHAARLTDAAELAKQAIVIYENKLPESEHQLAMSVALLANVLARQSWAEDAEQLFTKSLSIMEKNLSQHEDDYATVLRAAALSYQGHGKADEANQLFRKSFQLKERLIHYDQPAHLKGAVNAYWDYGSPDSGQLIEGNYPVRFLRIAGLRIAVVVVDLGDQKLGALVTWRNETGQDLEVGVGPVSLDVVSPKAAHLEQADIDSNMKVLEERTFQWLTRNQPFLTNVQITRRSPKVAPGEMPDLTHNLGGNVFGMYGDWPVSGSGDTDNVSDTHQVVEVTREIKASSNLAASDLLPVMLKPGESRSGLVFFRDPRFEEARLKLTLGNTTFSFPFKQNGRM